MELEGEWLQLLLPDRMEAKPEVSIKQNFTDIMSAFVRNSRQHVTLLWSYYHFTFPILPNNNTLFINARLKVGGNWASTNYSILKLGHCFHRITWSTSQITHQRLMQEPWVVVILSSGIGLIGERFHTPEPLQQQGPISPPTFWNFPPTLRQLLQAASQQRTPQRMLTEPKTAIMPAQAI